MKFNPVFKTILIAALSFPLVSATVGAAESDTDAIKEIRSSNQADREAALKESLHLSAEEGAAFWPLYHSYRADMDALGDSLVKLVLEYADAYPNVPEDRARQLLKEYMGLEEKIVSKRAWYLKKANKVLPAVKVLRWAQLENRMDIALRLQLASVVPLVPVR